MGKFSDKYDFNKAKLLKQLIEKSYKKGNFTLSSGKKSSHYLNCKPVSLNGEGLNLISDLFLELKDSRSKAVAGLTLGADPIVSGLIVKAALNGLDLDVRYQSWNRGPYIRRRNFGNCFRGCCYNCWFSNKSYKKITRK